MQILVLGMHRSGTSALGRILNLLGMYFAPEGLEMPPTDANPKGYWERRDVYQACETFLTESGGDWNTPSSIKWDRLDPEILATFQREMENIIVGMDVHRPWFIKEPRMCLLAPLIRPLLEVPVYLHIFRHPLEVADSLQKRDKYPITLGVALWEYYTVAALNNSQGIPGLGILHHDLLSEPLTTVRSIADQLGSLGVQELYQPSDQEIFAAIDPSLYHSKIDPAISDKWLTPPQMDLWRGIESGSILKDSKILTVSEGALEILIKHHDHVKVENAYSAQLKKASEMEATLVARQVKLDQQTQALASRNLEREKLADKLTEEQKRADVSEHLRQELSMLNQNLSEFFEKRVNSFDARFAELEAVVHSLPQSISQQAKELAAVRSEVLNQIVAGQENSLQFTEELRQEKLALAAERAIMLESRKQETLLRERLDVAYRTTRDLQTKLEGLQEQISTRKVRGKKLEKLLQQTEKRLERVVGSSRWKLGSYLSFRSPREGFRKTS